MKTRRTRTLFVGSALVAATGACTPVATIPGAREPDEAPPLSRDLGCLRVSVHPLARERRESVASVQFVYDFSNACPRPVRLGFAGVIVDARLSDGRRATLSPEPVTGDRLSGTIDAFDRGAEKIAYLAPSTNDDVSHAVQGVCVDVSRLEAGVVGQGPPMCFRRIAAGIYESAATLDADDGAAAAEPSGANVTAQPVSRTVDDSGLACTVVEHGQSTSRYCDRFGVWEPWGPFAGGLGLSTHHFALANRTVDGSDNHGAPGTLSAAPLGSLQVESLDIDFDVFLPPFYAGGEVQVGLGSVANPTTLYGNPHVGVADYPVAMFGAGVLAGVALPPLGPLSARGEVYGGWATMMLAYDQASPANNDCSADSCPGQSMSTWVLEPRLRLNTWLDPHMSIDAWGGLGVLQTGDWSAGVALTLHARSFDGMP